LYFRFIDMPVRRHIQDERLTNSVPLFSSRIDKSAMSSIKPVSTAKTIEVNTYTVKPV